MQISTEKLCHLNSAALYSSIRRLPSASQPLHKYPPLDSDVLVEVGAPRCCFSSHSLRLPSHESAGKANCDCSLKCLRHSQLACLSQQVQTPQIKLWCNGRCSLTVQFFCNSSFILGLDDPPSHLFE